MTANDILKTQQPYVEVPVLSALTPWLDKLEKEQTPYCIAKYAALAPNTKVIMRVFGIFLMPTVRQETSL